MENHLVMPDSYTPKRASLLRMEQPALADFADETFLTVADSESSCITPLLHPAAEAGLRRTCFPPVQRVALAGDGRGDFALNKEHRIYSLKQDLVFPPCRSSRLSPCSSWLKQTENPRVSLLVGELPKL